MKRRDFMQLLAATGLTAQAPLWTPKANAMPPEHFLVVVNAGGGWDPTSICDPKGLTGLYASNSDRHGGSTNSVDLDPNKTIGDIQWSAVPEFVSGDDNTLLRIESQYDLFFQTYGNQLTVINGIDNGTNNHETGNRATWSGNSDMGYPSLAAFYAASVSPRLPMAFISNGGYDFTDSLVARARASNANFVNEISDPNRYATDQSYLYRSANRSVDEYATVAAAQAARLARQQQSEALPLRRQQLGQLFNVRGEDSNLGALTVNLENIRNNVDRDANWNVNRGENLKSQAEVVVAAFQSGLCASANLSVGGFDTHGNHDQNAYPRYGDLLEGVHFLMQALTFAGIANRTTVVIGSDFGRTPYYNSGNGKDHWPITSVMVIDPRTNGPKLFGASTADFRATNINAQTGALDSNGVVLTPANVNQSLRRLLGVDQNDLAALYPLATDDFNIFS